MGRYGVAMSPVSSTRRRLAPERRRELIEAAALEVFSRQGYHAASMAQVARLAGVTKPVIYDHFASKDALHAHLLRRYSEALLARVEAAVADAERDGRAVPHALVAAFFAFVEEEPFARRLLFDDPDAGPDRAAAHRRGQMAVTRRIAAGMAEAGTLRGVRDRELRLELRAQALKTMLNGLADWWLDHPEVAREQVVAEAEAVLQRGLLEGARPG
jgi:AcrR family transcriptional regulator